MAEDTGKRCTKCGKWKPWDEFPVQSGGRASRCKVCQCEIQRQRRAADPEHVRKIGREAMRRYTAAHPEYAQRKREQYRKAREAVFDHYGRVCACPGCDATARLSIDHPNGDGAAHRTELFGHRNAAGKSMYLWLVEQGFPDGYQVLCSRCNTSKGRGRACRLPH